MTAIRLQAGRDHPAALRRQAGVEALGDAARWVLATLRAWRRRIRQRAEIARLNDRMLADIGLTRGEAEFLANKPFWRE